MSNANQVAETILEQLGGFGPLSAMIGAKGFTTEASGLEFKFTAKAKNKANYATITLDRNDTYTLKFGRIGRDHSVSPKGEMSGLQACDLRRVFQEATALYLSL